MLEARIHPKSWEIANFGLWIAYWLVGKNPKFAIRNPQCGGFGTDPRLEAGINRGG